jgi:hypothetical protein
MGAMRNAYRILVAEPEGRRLFGTPECRCEDNTCINPKWEGVDCIHLVEDRVQWCALLDSRVSLRAGDFLSS